MPPVSALSAALAHPDGPDDENAKASPETLTTAAWEALHRNVAFPCLRLARPDNVRVQEISTGHEDVDINRMTFPGTSVTAQSVPGSMVDYELNPHKRRGGKEVISSSYRGITAPGDARRASDANLITDAIFGSLRAGLTAEEKSSIKQSHTLSPSMNVLTELGLDKVNNRTAEAKKLRRHVLRGAVVVFVTAGYSGKRFIFERCKELGVRTVIIDGPDSWSKQLVDEGVAEKFVGIDFSEAETVFDRLVDVCKRVRRELGDIDGITTFCELAVPLVSRLAETLGLPGNTPLAVDTARNKHAARQCMQAASLPTPRHVMLPVDNPNLEAAAEHVQFPAVIKPISGAASIGVIRVDDLESLKKSYARVVKDLSNARVVAGALVEGSSDNADEGDAATWVDLSVMMEEYLDGPEVDVDLIFSEGQPVYGCVTDNWPTVEPYFNETGSNCPSILSWDQQVQLLDLGIKAVQCMGFELGVFHVELKYTSRGPRLIEVNARMGGGPVRVTNLLVWGVDLVEEHVLASCGIPCKPSVAQKPLQELAEYTINAPMTGVLERDDFMAKFQGMEGVLYARPLVTAGAKCVSANDGMPTWLAEIMVSRSPVEKAIEWVKELEQEVTANLPIRPA